MKNRIGFVFACGIAAMLMAPNAQAQCPLATLSGPWVFSTDGFSLSFLTATRLPGVNFQFLGSAGRFVASVGADSRGNPIGVLAITQTTSINGSITRLETDAGRYQLTDDCLGGTLTFNAGSRPVQFDFFFVNAGEMELVGSNNGDMVSGSARAVTPVVCTPTPLSAIAGTWVFSVDTWDAQRGLPVLVAAGRIVVNGGVLTATQTAGVYSGNVRHEVSQGRVSVNDDCTGGTMTFAIGAQNFQLDFFFANANRLVLSGISGGDIIIGHARRLGSL